ncbi:MAG: hypothetical protein ACYC2H_06745 [Thermoplasmatota archaeon]
MRPLYALVATLGLVFLAAPVSANAPTDASCAGEACDLINRVCQKVGGGSCVGAVSSSEDLPVDGRCVGLPCDVINAVCRIALKTSCVG